MEDDEELTEELVYATAARDVKRVEELMECGISPCRPTKNGACPLHTAVVLESPIGPNIVSRMLDYGADPNVKTDTGLSPLHIAAMWGRVDTLNLLLDNGANVADKDDDDMSALDYAEEAESYKDECIDALTRYRPRIKRKSGCFLSKSRYHLDKILGGDMIFSSFDATSLNMNNASIFDDGGENKKCASTQTGSVCASTQTDFDAEDQPLNSGILQNRRRNELEFEDALLNETLFQTCSVHFKDDMLEGESCSHIASSTLLEEASNQIDRNYDSNEQSDLFEVSQMTPSSTGYIGDASENLYSEVPSDHSVNETFWSVWSTPPHSRNSPGQSPITIRKKKGQTNTPDSRGDKKTRILKTELNSDLFVPASSPLSYANSNGTPKCAPTNDTCRRNSQNDLNQNVGEKCLNVSSNISGLIDDVQLIRNLSNLLSEVSSDESVRYNDYHQIDATNMAAEATIDYSSGNRSVSKLVEYYEKTNDEQLVMVEDEEQCSPSKKLDRSMFEIVNLNDNAEKDDENTRKRRQSMLDYSGITIDYDWKDVSQLNATIEVEESMVRVPEAILALSSVELRDRLLKLGERIGPITETTKCLYQRHLARIEKADHNFKPGDKYKDYTVEMRQVLTEATLISKEKGGELESEMAYIFEKPEKHTWREGCQKTSFNYILLDPRVTKNLPDRSDQLSDVDRFRIFAAAIFYIGKGKKSRPYEHFYKAAKEDYKTERNKPVSNKIKMIRDIWEAGYGVASVHLFHSVIPVEAYTREACMIDAMGLSRLTNLKYGDVYGPTASWNSKKRRHLGIHLLTKAMNIYLIEGERQIRKKDLVK